MISTLVCSDSSTYLEAIEPGTYRTIVTSPRYNKRKDYGPGVNDWTDRFTYLAEMHSFGIQLLRVASDDCVFFLNVGDDREWPARSHDVLEQYVEAGWTHVQSIVWMKSFDGRGQFTPIRGAKRLDNLYEFIFILVKNPRRYTLDRLAVGREFSDKSNLERYDHASDRRCAGNIWFIPYETCHQTLKKGHTCPFPVELPKRAIKLNGCKGPVLDPFAGICTTGYAATELGVESTCIDMIPQNIKTGREWIASINDRDS